MSVEFHQTVQRHIPEDSHGCENLKSSKVKVVLVFWDVKLTSWSRALLEKLTVI
jgi:hypothetical protein